MKKLISVQILSIALLALISAQDDSPLKGPYLGQDPPGTVPVIFAPGFISTDLNELNSVFYIDGKEFYFTRNDPDKGFAIHVTREEKSGWSRPVVANFSGKHPDVDMCITYDGKRMYYASQTPVEPDAEPDKIFKIWYVDRSGDVWSEAKFLGEPVNNGTRMLYPTVTKEGTLYFQGIHEVNYGSRDIYKAKFENGVFLKPENIGPVINSSGGEGDVLVAPDESYVIVCTQREEDCYGEADLYISYREADGSWKPLKNMGPSINSDKVEYCPMISPDGKYFFYTSKKTGNGDIYWIDSKILDKGNFY